jgi:hypothetical protein
MSDNKQSHPLHAIDRDQVDACLGHQGEPGPQQLTTIAALFSRYADFPGAEDIKDDLQKCLTLWKLSRDELNAKTREIWASGWRPGMAPQADGVGSGADVEDTAV